MTEDSVRTKISRRSLLSGAAITGALHAFPLTGFAQDSSAKGAGKLKLSMFSKLLQWTDVKEAAAIARDLGFDALDLTVRPRGHVLPERVEIDLPRAVETARKAGLEISMISTEIMSSASPYAESILKTASQLGIRNYRWGGLTYKPTKGIAEQINELKPQVRALAELNREHNICGMYHTHSGPNMIGGPIWDLWLLLQGLDSQWIGMNYDIGHATIEGGYGGWQTSARLARDSMRGIALKDFRWPSTIKAASPAIRTSGILRPLYEPEWCPIGEGMVDFRGFFEIVKQNGFSGPVQMHFEYPEFGGAENGDTVLRISKQQLITAVRKDLTYIKGIMRDLNLAA